jgi:hypothetical protein
LAGEQLLVYIEAAEAAAFTICGNLHGMPVRSRALTRRIVTNKADAPKHHLDGVSSSSRHGMVFRRGNRTVYWSCTASWARS